MHTLIVGGGTAGHTREEWTGGATSAGMKRSANAKISPTVGLLSSCHLKGAGHAGAGQRNS